jgi:hypothetical protein
MGINKTMAKYLAKNKNILNFKGSLLTLGRQDIGVSYKELNEIGITDVISDSYPTDQDFFKMLGFEKVDSLEHNLMDNATIAHDLNEPLPSELFSRFDWVLDGGTLEHCFNVKEFMFSMIKLLKPGGSILHINPSLGCSNHGLFNFQPTFYFSFYRANKFQNSKCDLLEMQSKTSDLFIDKNIKARVIPINNFNNLDFATINPVYNVFYSNKPSELNLDQIKMPIQEFYYEIFKEKEKVNGGMIEENLYNKIVGNIKENNSEEILKNAYFL